MKEYKNLTRVGYGVDTLPDGKDYYRACVKWHLSFDQSPEEIHQIGLQEVERISRQMHKVGNCSVDVWYMQLFVFAL